MSLKHNFADDAELRNSHLAGVLKVTQDRNRAYFLIVLLLICLIGLSIAVTVLSSIHTVVPVIAVVDANGHVVKQQVVNKDTLSGQESFVQSQIFDFVTSCNTFDPNWRQRYADLCRLHSTPSVAKQYDAETAPENPTNPYYLVGSAGKRYPRITGITRIAPDSFQVSFQSISEKPGTSPKVEYFTALIRYIFTLKPLAVGDRWENPLGFAATAYRKDEELSRQ